MKQISALLFLWGMVSAWAMVGAAEIAVHPLHIETAPSGTTTNALKQVFRDQVFRVLPEQTDSAEVERFLRHRGEASCWGDDGCIVALAKAVRARHVLLVSVVRTEPWIIMSARVLSDNGAELRNIPIAVHTPDADVSEIANFANGFSALFTALNLSTLPTSSSSTLKAKAAAPPSMSGMRVATWVTAGVAVAGVVTGGVFTALFYSEHDKLLKDLGDGVSQANKSETALKHMRRSQDYKTMLIVGYAVGGAALATSVTLFFLSPEFRNKPTVAFVPQQGGGTLTLSANF